MIWDQFEDDLELVRMVGGRLGERERKGKERFGNSLS